ncbi:hypothetical protein CICLE_v10033486mg [Citrus x clementina]|uniref:ATPase family AAA domain-containing protein n=1 Tax=Citrus clementina TaxID=85681 RepID=V4TBI7_CITCL|nr:hypothetical protein CICLE_v10033486mg [Citrus x clementina]
MANIITLAATSASTSSQSNTAFADGPLNISVSPLLHLLNLANLNHRNSLSDLQQRIEMSPLLLLPVPRLRNDNPKATSASFDLEPLERGAKLLREIGASPNPFEFMKKQGEA